MKVLPKKFKSVIIGAGPGGYTAAIRIAALGGSVCIIEKANLGGVCVNTGCIPTKFLISVAKLLSSIKKSGRFGIEANDVSHDIKKIQEQTRRVATKSAKGIGSLLKSYGVHVISGVAFIENPTEVSVYESDKKENELATLKSENIIIATGASPITLASSKKVLTSNDVFELEALPKNLLIVGGGYIGLEFAFIFNSLGVKVSVVEKLPRILNTEDEDISKEIKRMMERKGIEVRENTELKDVENDIKHDAMLVAIGRKPNFNQEELNKLKVKFTDNGIETDSSMRTNIEGIYAIGDVNGKSLLAHTAAREGIVAAENIMGKKTKIDYKTIPSAVFTIPEIASVGEGKGKVGRFPFMANGKATATNETEGFVKVYLDKKKLVGASIIGQGASDLIAVVQGFLGKTIEEIKSVVIAHPTLPEAIFEAILDSEKEAINLPKKT